MLYLYLVFLIILELYQYLQVCEPTYLLRFDAALLPSLAQKHFLRSAVSFPNIPMLSLEALWFAGDINNYHVLIIGDAAANLLFALGAGGAYPV